MIKSYWGQLEAKQRYVVLFGAIFVGLALLFELVIFPLADAKAKMTKSIAASTRRLTEMNRLDAEFSAHSATIRRIQQSLAARGAGFTLFSHLEKKAQAAGVKGSIRQMSSVPGVKSGAFEESLIDMKLDRITIKQLTDFLQQVEAPIEMIRIKRITLAKMKEAPEYLSAQLLIAAYTPAIGRPGGP